MKHKEEDFIIKVRSRRVEENGSNSKKIELRVENDKDGLRHIARTCKVCARATSKYTCPRCNAPYCSVACYKNHGLTCSESFYREHVEDRLKVEKISEKDKAEVLRALKETYEEERFVPSENTWKELEALERLSLKDDISMEDLSEDQRRRFMNAVRGGHLSSHVKIWTPWWTRSLEEHRKRYGIVDLDDPKVDTTKLFCVCLNVSKTTAPKILLKRAPDARLMYHLVDILYAYVHVMRTYNGKHDTDCIDAASTLYDASVVLSNPKEAMKLSSTSHVVRNSIERLRLRFGGSHKRDTRFETLASDVLAVLKCRHFILDALHDSFIILKQALDLTSSRRRRRRNARDQTVRMSWKRASKKILYFLSWITKVNDGDTSDSMTMSEKVRVSLYKDLALSIQLMKIEREGSS